MLVAPTAGSGPASDVKSYRFWPSIGLFFAAFATLVGATIVGLVVAGILFALHVLPRAQVKTISSVTVQTVQDVAYLAMIGVLVRWLPRVAKCSLAEAGLGLDRLREWKPLLVAAATAVLLEFAIEPLYLAAIHETDHVQAGFEGFAPSGFAEFFAAGLGIVVLAPVGEELLFRGLLFQALRRHMPMWASALAVGSLFGAVHGDLVIFPIIALMGTLSAVLYGRTGNLWAAIALHATNNGISFAQLVADSLTKHH